MQITDGKGTGTNAAVNSDNHLETFSCTIPAYTYHSQFKGDTYAWKAVSADIDATDTALLVCNNSTTQYLCIEKIYVWADTAVQFQVHLPAYPTLAGTAVTGVNLNTSSGNTALASAYADETGNTQGSIITTVRNTEGGTEEEGQWIEYNGAVVLDYHKSIAVDIVAESAAFECVIIGYFVDKSRFS